MRLIQKFTIGLLAILVFVYLLLPSQSENEGMQVIMRNNEINYDNEYIQEVTADYQFLNQSIFKLLHEANYFKNLKSYKLFEKDLCNIPQLDIWSSKIKELLHKTPVYDKCQKNSPLTYIKENRLYIDDDVNSKFYNNSIVDCEFAPVIRSAIKNDNYILAEYEGFSDGLPMIDDVVKVRCRNKNKEIKYEYVHYIIQRKEKLKDKKAAAQKLNVLIFIFDSVSASSFKRSLPKTFSYLKSFDNFFHFTKHHTVGQNTLPNLVPMFAGKKSEELLGKEVMPPPFDDFPFIWNKFSQNNYITYFNEDWRNSMFNNDKFGFRQSPTDFYMKHFWLSAYNSLSSAPNKQNSNLKPCYYDKLFHRLSFDWLTEFQREYAPNQKPDQTDQNLFGIVKSNEMSHDYLERLFWVDEDMKKMLEDLFTPEFLKNTLFVLMGDHGHRFHKIRKTYVGKIEEKLPFFSMMLPTSLLENNPFMTQVLRQNTQTLTTFYDVHETLRQLLIDQRSMQPAQSLYLKQKNNDQPNQGFSLFWPVPYRNCDQAMIPEYLCSCQKDSTTSLSKNELDLAKKGAVSIVEHINEVLLGKHKDICAPLVFMKLNDAQIVDKKLQKYSVIFETGPNGAIFDGLVQLKENEKFELIGKISRINLYGSTAKCMADYFLKNFCYCKSNIVT